MLRPVSVACALLASLLLTGCGGGGSDRKAPEETPVTESPDYLMQADGNRWVYDLSYGMGGAFHPLSTQLVELTATTLLDGSPVLHMTERSVDGWGFLLNARFRVNNGVFEQVFDASDDEPLASRGSMPMLRLPLRAGDRYDLYRFPDEPAIYDYDADGIMDSVTTRGWIDEIAPDRVEVPAGTFDTLRVTRMEERAWINSGDGSPDSFVLTERTWYAPGIGPVMKANNLPLPFEYWWKLTDYRVGTRSTDTTPPHVVAASPEPGSVHARGSAPFIHVSLSEKIDPLSPEITIHDSAMQLVEGEWIAHPDSLGFAANRFLPADTYTVTLHNVTDMLGNPLPAPYTWSFTLTEE